METVRRCYEAINSIGRTGEEFVDPEEVSPEMWEAFAPDVVLHGRSDVPDSTTFHGREETKEFWRRLQEVFAEVSWEPEEFTDLGDVVVVDAKLSVLGRGSDVPIVSDESDVFWFRDGMVSALQAFPTHEQAMAAAASPPPAD